MGDKKKFVKVVDRKTRRVFIEKVRWCSSRMCRLLGFQFRRRLKPGEALILVHRRESVSGSSIHMFFVFTSLAVVWINSQGRVTHTTLAQPWRPYYASREPACYVLEAAPELLEHISPGDELDIM